MMQISIPFLPSNYYVQFATNNIRGYQILKEKMYEERPSRLTGKNNAGIYRSSTSPPRPPALIKDGKTGSRIFVFVHLRHIVDHLAPLKLTPVAFLFTRRLSEGQ